MRFTLVVCGLLLAFPSPSFAKDEITMDSELAEGSIWEGTVKRYVGGMLSDTRSARVTVTKRKNDEFEAEWEDLNYKTKFLFKGKVKGNKLSGGFEKVLEGEDKVAKDVIGHAKLLGLLKVQKERGKDDQITIKGTYVVPGTNRTAGWNLKPVEE